MFTLLRGIIIIGVIFYFSPARHMDEPEAQASGGGSPSPVAPSGRTEEGQALDGLFDRLVGQVTEEVVRTAVNDKVQSAAGLRLKGDGSRPPAEAGLKPVSQDKLWLSGADAASLAQTSQSVRCVYRCDGSE